MTKIQAKYQIIGEGILASSQRGSYRENWLPTYEKATQDPWGASGPSFQFSQSSLILAVIVNTLLV